MLTRHLHRHQCLQSIIWYCVRESNPSLRLEGPRTYPEVQRSIIWCGLIESNYLATTLLNNAYRVTAGNREQPAKFVTLSHYVFRRNHDANRECVLKYTSTGRALALITSYRTFRRIPRQLVSCFMGIWVDMSLHPSFTPNGVGNL